MQIQVQQLCSTVLQLHLDRGQLQSIRTARLPAAQCVQCKSVPQLADPPMPGPVNQSHASGLSATCSLEVAAIFVTAVDTTSLRTAVPQPLPMASLCEVTVPREVNRQPTD